MNRKEIIDLIKKTRKQYEKAQSLEDQIFDLFKNSDIDLSVYPGGCNSDNLQDMITCYFMYHEDSIEEIEERLKEIEVSHE